MTFTIVVILDNPICMRDNNTILPHVREAFGTTDNGNRLEILRAELISNLHLSCCCFWIKVEVADTDTWMPNIANCECDAKTGMNPNRFARDKWKSFQISHIIQLILTLNTKKLLVLQQNFSLQPIECTINIPGKNFEQICVPFVTF